MLPFLSRQSGVGKQTNAPRIMAEVAISEAKVDRDRSMESTFSQVRIIELYHHSTDGLEQSRAI